MGRGATGCSKAERTLEQNDPSIDPSIAGSVRCHVHALCGMGAPLGEMVNARSKSETCATPGGSSFRPAPCRAAARCARLGCGVAINEPSAPIDHLSCVPGVSASSRTISAGNVIWFLPVIVVIMGSV
jgi:hypothetical protein